MYTLADVSNFCRLIRNANGLTTIRLINSQNGESSSYQQHQQQQQSDDDFNGKSSPNEHSDNTKSDAMATDLRKMD